ncbi:MAG: CPBP family intramembrane glutamic endopeptidase [Verrucomicrobiota bacterium]
MSATANRTNWVMPAVILAMVLPLASSLFYFVWFSGSPLAKAIYSGTKVFTLVWPFLVWHFFKGQIFRWRPEKADWVRWGRAVPLGVLSGVIIVGAMFLLLRSGPMADMVNQAGPEIRKKTVEMGVLKYFWVFAVFLSVFHAMIEEIFWRWFVFGELREKLSLPMAYLLGAVSFAAHHIVVTTQFFPLAWGILLGALVGVGGLIFSWLYHRQQTLAGAWISHMIVDFGLMAVGYRLIMAAA